MRRGTTPTLVFTVDPLLDLSTLAEAWLTIYQAGEVATKTLPDLTQTENGFSVTLTQEETLRLCAGAGCPIQLRAVPAGRRVRPHRCVAAELIRRYT